MCKTIIILIYIFISINCHSQDIIISFLPKTAGKIIDSTVVINFRTDQKNKLIGNETLTLTKTTVAEKLQIIDGYGFLYPNPAFCNTTISYSINNDQRVEIFLVNTTGHQIAKSTHDLSSGNHEFLVTFPQTGFFTISIISENRLQSYKAICIGTNGQKCEISHLGCNNRNHMKNALIGKTLDYLQGDILHYSVYSGKNNTIITDSPTITKVYDVEFYDCIDSDNYSYPIVNIDNQWWTAKNLVTTKFNDGTVITDPLGGIAYVTYPAYSYYMHRPDLYKDIYGAHYNWYAASSGKICPLGWHVPSDSEWIKLDLYLQANGYNYDGSVDTDTLIWTNNKIAKSLASRTNWSSTTLSNRPGNNPITNNKSGFSGIPSGYIRNGASESINVIGYWWTSTLCTEYSEGRDGWMRYLMYNGVGLSRSHYTKENAMSVRCIKN